MHLPQAVPWYREPWPWILISGPAIVVVAGFYTLYLAVVGADPLVVDNYYKEGLAINRVLERDQAAVQRRVPRGGDAEPGRRRGYGCI